MDKKITVFVSSSWDSGEHQEWVRKLVGDLKSVGIDATMDNLEREHQTVHLGEMIASSVHKNIYTLVIMSPLKYLEKKFVQEKLGLFVKYLIIC